MARETMWELLDAPDVVARLAHIGDHYAVVKTIRPRSVEDLAICLALIRPGKRYLIGKSRAEIDADVWKKGEGYSFKKSHAIAYAVSIIVQMNLICEEVENSA
jgi:DNA polymerase III alpha subunit